MLNRRKVSQERVIGISFVDILIQAVFLLLLILMVGYVDPIEQDKFKFHEAGKDLCNKLNKDSPVACIEFVKGKDVKVSDPAPKVPDPSFDFCVKRKLSLKECKATLDKMADNIDLFPCIPPSSASQLTRSIYWSLKAPGEIEFVKFSDEYLNYLKKKGYLDKLAKVNSIISQGKKIYSPSEISSVFGFMRDDGCFHEYLASRPGKFNDSDLAKEFEAIRALRK